MKQRVKDFRLPSKIINLYERLGIEPTASFEEVRLAYRNLALRFHPDRKCNEFGKEKDLDGFLTEEFKALQEAYSTLKDPSKRAAYDLKPGREQHTPPQRERTHTSAGSEKRYSFKKDFRGIYVMDSFFSEEQVRNLNYLDSLIEAGEIKPSNNEGVFAGLDHCFFCKDIIAKARITLSYQKNSLYHFNNYVHVMFSHGMRAAILEHTRKNQNQAKTCAQAVNRSFNIMVDTMYERLNLRAA